MALRCRATTCRRRRWSRLARPGTQNHHAWPRSARLGVERGQADPGWWVLVALRRAGLVWNPRGPQHLVPQDGLRRLGSPDQADPRTRCRGHLRGGMGGREARRTSSDPRSGRLPTSRLGRGSGRREAVQTRRGGLGRPVMAPRRENSAGELGMSARLERSPAPRGPAARAGPGRVGRSQDFRWAARCLFISNMVHLSLPKTFLSLSSARISRLFAGF
jgi:hypothetical protein